MALQFAIRSLKHIKVISFIGELNSSTSKTAEIKLTDLIMGGNNKLMVDFHQVDYISSAGLRILLVANKLVTKKKGELRIFGLKNTVKEVFEISGFDMIFNIYDDENTAIIDF